jgi:hypothetical protein
MGERGEGGVQGCRDMEEYRGKVVKEVFGLGWIHECVGVLRHSQAP